MRFIINLGTCAIGFCIGYLLSGTMWLVMSRGDALKVLVVSAVVVAACSFVSRFAGKQSKKKRW